MFRLYDVSKNLSVLRLQTLLGLGSLVLPLVFLFVYSWETAMEALSQQNPELLAGAPLALLWIPVLLGTVNVLMLIILEWGGRSPRFEAARRGLIEPLVLYFTFLGTGITLSVLGGIKYAANIESAYPLRGHTGAVILLADIFALALLVCYVMALIILRKRGRQTSPQSDSLDKPK